MLFRSIEGEHIIGHVHMIVHVEPFRLDRGLIQGKWSIDGHGPIIAWMRARENDCEKMTMTAQPACDDQVIGSLRQILGDRLSVSLAERDHHGKDVSYLAGHPPDARSEERR